jgi:acyl-CoA synthetase (NDP forming)
VVTVSTGEASLIADLVPATGLNLPAIPGPARAAILESLPTMGYIGNPLDPWGAADATAAYGAAFEAMAASRAYDVLVLVHDFPYRSLPSEVNTANEVTAALLAATADRPEILPVYASLTSGEPPPETKALLDTVGGGAPLLRGAVAAFRAIAEVAAWEGRHARRVDAGPWRDGWPALAADRTSYGGETTATPPPARGARTPVALSEPESLAFIGRTGIAVSEVLAVPDAAAAVSAARTIGVPVALKLDAVGLAHKSDVGGVALGLRGDDAVYGAALTLLEVGRRRGLTVRGLLISAMAPHGVELILGYRRDPHFGPTVLVGFGGVLTEVLDDVAIRLAPLDHAAADAMLDDLRGSPILGALRGRPAVDRGTVAEMLVALSRLGVERPDVLEVDLNPVIASAGGAIAVDALVVLEAGDS